MPISYSTLRAAAASPEIMVARSITEAKEFGYKTAFLCHSHNDRQLVEGFVNYARKKGWRIYIDWMDTTLPATPNRETASKIKSKIKSSDFFIFLATFYSMNSRWCPWEIGFADGTKPIDKIFIVPTVDDDGDYHGNEYLQLYRRVDVATDGDLAAWYPGRTQDGIEVSRL